MKTISYHKPHNTNIISFGEYRCVFQNNTNSNLSGDNAAYITMATKAVNNFETIDAIVKRIDVRVYQETVRYRLTFVDTFAGVTKVDDIYEERQIDYIDFVPRYLIANLIDKVSGVSVLYNRNKEAVARGANIIPFGITEVSAILDKAVLTLKRTKFESGDEYTTENGEVLVHTNAGYTTEIVDIKVRSAIKDKLERLLDSVLGL